MRGELLGRCGNFAIDIVFVLMSYLGPVDCVRVCCRCCAIPESCCGYSLSDLLYSVYLVWFVHAHEDSNGTCVCVHPLVISVYCPVLKYRLLFVLVQFCTCILGCIRSSISFYKLILEVKLYFNESRHGCYKNRHE